METLFIGRQRFKAEDVPSTNTWALSVLREDKVSEGAVFTTVNQSEGRGQRGNTWISEPGKNITASFVLFPKFLAPADQFLISQLASLAVVYLLEDLADTGKFDFFVKWPNDVYANEMKIAGILVENVLRENTLSASVIGIGLNVNQKNFTGDFYPTSIANLTETETDLEKCLSKLCSKLESLYLLLKTGRSEFIRSEYHKRLYRLNEKHFFSCGEEKFQGTIRGVNHSGLLNIELNSRENRLFDLKELKFLKE